ncbi:MAG: nitroreductase family protein [Acidimicrobiia bacterium]
MDRTEAALLEALTLIKGRRTNLRIDPARPVAPALVERLCEAGTWAPNHKLTEPWRFAALTGSARTALGEIVAADLARRGVDDPARLEKARIKYLRAPVIVGVGCIADRDAIRHLEDRDAVAAAVQNLLLAATAAGLASYWATGAATRLPEARRLCGFDADTEIVALIYLGWPTGPAPATNRSEPDIVWVDS